jgi:translation initiation factor 3 subunit E
MAEMDLTARMAPFLDVHMQIKLLDFIEEKGVFPSSAVGKQRLRCLLATDLIEQTEAEFSRLSKSDSTIKNEFNDALEAAKSRAQEHKNELDSLTSDPILQKIKTVLTDQSQIETFRASKMYTLEGLAESDVDFNETNFTKYTRMGKLLYEMGNYEETDLILSSYLTIDGCKLASSSSSIIWGRLASKLLLGKNLNECYSDFKDVRLNVEYSYEKDGKSNTATQIEQLTARAWILHWSMFLQFANRDDKALAEKDNIFVADYDKPNIYMQVMENLCPWMLRYHIVSTILSSRQPMSSITKLVEQIKIMRSHYEDPFGQFIIALYSDFDFDLAQLKMKECCTIASNDFFLSKHSKRFRDQARLLMCEVYCQIHRTVNLVTLSQQLELQADEAEKWMVDMVRSATTSNVDRRIDSSEKLIIMRPPVRSAYEGTMEFTRELNARSSALVDNLDFIVQKQSSYAKLKAEKNKTQVEEVTKSHNFELLLQSGVSS